MTKTFEITNGLKRGVKGVYCYAVEGGFCVVREACSFRTPLKCAKFETVAECREWASEFVK